MQQTTVKIIELIEKSGLLSAEDLQRALGEFEADGASDLDADGGAAFLRYLLHVGMLTKWQADKLAQGRHKGFVLGNYKLLGRIGAGGMSTVYLAEHRFMRQRRALKILPAHRIKDSSYLERFYREARAAAALDHNNVVHAYDVGSDGDTHYFVMEYVEGIDLQKMIVRRGVLSYESAADVIRQTADGLAHAHRAGVVHRDIKPANLLVNPEGTVKILDMGLARYAPEEMERQASLTQEHDEKVIGTTNYLAPEQALNSHDADGRADIYGLGCTLYFLLTGRPPFNTGSVAQRLMAHLHQEPDPITNVRPNAPSGLVAICKKMMAKKPADRFQSAQELAGVMKQWLREWSQSDVRPASGVALGSISPDLDEGDVDAPATGSSLRDTDVVRAQMTSIGKRRPAEDDELQLADLDDVTARSRKDKNGLPNKSGSTSDSRSAAERRAASVAKAPATTGGKSSPKIELGPSPQTNDFLSEILAMPAAAAAPSVPASPGLSRPHSSAPRSQRSPVRKPATRSDGDDVKRDVEKLFQKHPVFAAVVFIFFSGLLVFGLYYMIRNSDDASTNATIGIGGSRD